MQNKIADDAMEVDVSIKMSKPKTKKDTDEELGLAKSISQLSVSMESDSTPLENAL